MPIAKVLARGQVTLPREVRRKAGIKPGDTVHIRVTGPQTLELTVERLPTLAEALARWSIDEPVPEWRTVAEEAERGQADELIRREIDGDRGR